ncbi:acyl-CoA dehydrogenase family protein [Streptomyces acidiscabies]|uniref:Acyl-CoA dehydrogenase n=1 Tax=Streptomyces acidiscabies TaxID=42234 RepID=A0A0L0KGS1_9ACTN|nr:acyl-CoA dehydrogenase family protein [Streptomyces acidiscabies]KND37016.1 acyl-CoA dehydrogenase [Streptomyces acidiscabies]
MRFSVTEVDAALAEAAGGVLAKPDVWRMLAEVGVLGALVPGEAGLDENCLPPLMERLGHSGVPVPAAETIAVGAPLLAELPVMAEVLDGSALLTVSLSEGSPVPFAARADLVALAAAGRIRLFRREELSVEPLESVDATRQLARVTAPARGGVLLTDDPSVLEVARRRGVLATSGLLVGLGTRMVELTVAYVREREQFGVPVGSFQAVKHTLADALVALRFARASVLAAGWAQAAGDADADVRTSAAKVLASEAARKTARAAIQCHGAIGYTTEYDLHRYAKRAWALAADWGGPAHHRALIATRLGLSQPRGDAS